MVRDLIPSKFWQLPSVFDDEWSTIIRPQSGVSISEDENNVYVEVHTPGINPKDIDVTLDRGILRINGEAKEEEEDRKRKYYRRAERSATYSLTLPSEIDPNAEPEAECKNGVTKVTIPKSTKARPKKIAVKSA